LKLNNKIVKRQIKLRHNKSYILLTRGHDNSKHVAHDRDNINKKEENYCWTYRGIMKNVVLCLYLR